MDKWLPVPERLVRDIETAPRADKRAWAIASLVIWMMAFYRLRRGDECSLRDLRSWSCSNSQSRAKKGKADAQSFLDAWTDPRPPVDQSQTSRRPPVDHPQTRGAQVLSELPKTSRPPVDRSQTTRRPPVDQSQTDHARSSLQSTSTSTSTISVLWGELETIRKAAGPCRAWRLTAQRKKQIKARLSEHQPEDLKTVWAWWLTSDHSRARFLRERDTTTTTILGAKFTDYLELAEKPAQQQKPTTTGSGHDPFNAWLEGDSNGK